MLKFNLCNLSKNFYFSLKIENNASHPKVKKFLLKLLYHTQIYNSIFLFAGKDIQKSEHSLDDLGRRIKRKKVEKEDQEEDDLHQCSQNGAAFNSSIPNRIVDSQPQIQNSLLNSGIDEKHSTFPEYKMIKKQKIEKYRNKKQDQERYKVFSLKEVS